MLESPLPTQDLNVFAQILFPSKHVLVLVDFPTLGIPQTDSIWSSKRQIKKTHCDLNVKRESWFSARLICWILMWTMHSTFVPLLTGERSKNLAMRLLLCVLLRCWSWAFCSLLYKGFMKRRWPKKLIKPFVQMYCICRCLCAPLASVGSSSFVFAVAVCTARVSFRVCRCSMHCPLKFRVCRCCMHCPPKFRVCRCFVHSSLKFSCLQLLYALLVLVFVFAGAASAAFGGYRGCKCCIHFPLKFSW